MVFGRSLRLFGSTPQAQTKLMGRELKTPKHSPAGYERETVHSLIHDHHDGRDRKFIFEGCQGEECTGASSIGHSLHHCGCSCCESAVLCYKYVYVNINECLGWRNLHLAIVPTDCLLSYCVRGCEILANALLF